MADSKVDLGAGSPDRGTFRVGAFEITPRFFGEGSRTSRNFPIELPGDDGNIEQTMDQFQGKFGLDFRTGDTEFGGAASGQYSRGEVEFSDELQQYGAPDRETFGTRGMDATDYSAYFRTPVGPGIASVDVGYNPITDDKRGRLGYQVNFGHGGDVQPMGMMESVTVTQVMPKNDPRSVALGSRLLKQAGIPGNPDTLMKQADPRVISQVNRIMPSTSMSAPSAGIGMFMTKSMFG